MSANTLINDFLNQFPTYSPAYYEIIHRNGHFDQNKFFISVVGENLIFLLENRMEVPFVKTLFNYFELKVGDNDLISKEIISKILILLVEDKSLIKEARKHMCSNIKQLSYIIEESMEYYELGMECIEEGRFQIALEYFEESLSLYINDETRNKINECKTEL
ncbi:hypothetical protein AN960_09835 [Bacillus sp. FJAT-25509]|uniref:tetratricopeptide repeat protein n=1 Tax=Bacillus sp. FJAT-25509 TaxID=1712029 RepID=UPI0006F6BA3B|nr:tetratricopeptide repeat protein [Bacillus sp. FJAT-25509]KQL39258.1 hypothetical protein AN960_09835 [Bacillus sp. FJAT-25509]